MQPLNQHRQPRLEKPRRVRTDGFSKIRGTSLGVPMTRIEVFGGLYWGPPICGNDQMLVHLLLLCDPGRVRVDSLARCVTTGVATPALQHTQRRVGDISRPHVADQNPTTRFGVWLYPPTRLSQVSTQRFSFWCFGPEPLEAFA